VSAPTPSSTEDQAEQRCHIWHVVSSDSVEKTTLYLPNDVQRRLRELSRQQRRSQAELIREAVAQYLAGQEQPWPKSIGAAESDGAVPAARAREWIDQERSSPNARPWRRSERE
jgi:predicted transcriptional regulator